MAADIHASTCPRVGVIKSFAAYEIEAPDIIRAIVTDARELIDATGVGAEYNVLPCANQAGLKMVRREVNQ
jgi:hypothetical protein